MTDKRFRCKECGGSLTISEYGELVCTNCGLVNDKIYLPPLFEIEPLSDFSATSKVYVSPDWKPTRSDGLGTIILRCRNFLKKDRSNISNYIRFMKLSYIHEIYSRDPFYKSTLNAFYALRRACSNLRVSSHIFQRASYIFLKAIKHVREAGSSYVIAAASLLIAVRDLNYPITLREIASTFSQMGHRVLAKSISKAAILIARRLNINWKLRRVEDYLPRIVNNLKFIYEVNHRINDLEIDKDTYFNSLLNVSYKIAKILDDKIRMGKNPYLLAISIVYIADKIIAKELNCKPILSQKTLAIHLKSTEYTIRQHFKIINEILKRHGISVSLNYY